MRLAPAVLLSAALTLPSVLTAAPITLLHTWQAPNEEKALTVFERDLAKFELEPSYQIPTLEERKVAGNIKTLAKSLDKSTTFLSLTNGELKHWYDLRLLHSLTAVAEKQGWAESIPQVVLDTVTHRGQIIAAPVSVHISNWIWANKQLVDNTGLSLSGDWDNFLAILENLREQGVTPIAHDNTETQDILMFETLYLSLFGAEKYRVLFEELNLTALRKAEAEFEQVFARLQALKPHIDRLEPGSQWHQSVDLITSAQAGLIIQGDWASGEFARQGRIANQHYYCVEFPGEFQAAALRVDAVASLNVNAQPLNEQQYAFYQSAVNKDLQYLFANYKGGLPAIKDTGLETISECLTFSVQRTQTALETNSLVPSLSQGLAVRDVVKNEIGAVINEFMLNNIAPDVAANTLQKRMKYANYLIN